MKESEKNKFDIKNKKSLLILLLLIIIAAVIGYLGYQTYQLGKNKVALESQLVQTRARAGSAIRKLDGIIESLQQNLATTTTERNDFENKYNNEKNRMDSFSQQINTVQSTVGVLQKLSQTDSELLKKYSRVYFLNENYVPKTLIIIASKYTYDTQKDYLFYAETWPFLQGLLQSAEATSADMKIISAYRSFGAQSGLKASYKMVYGSGANAFSADQGYSEHQLGTTIDFTTSKVGATFTGFEKTSTYQWLLDNAYKYGFILSYPKDNKYYEFEPWHWRFVGRALAEKLHQEGKDFYDLDQREINQYLVSFFD